MYDACFVRKEGFKTLFRTLLIIGFFSGFGKQFRLTTSRINTGPTIVSMVTGRSGDLGVRIVG